MSTVLTTEAAQQFIRRKLRELSVYAIKNAGVEDAAAIGAAATRLRMTMLGVMPTSGPEVSIYRRVFGGRPQRVRGAAGVTIDKISLPQTPDKRTKAVVRSRRPRGGTLPERPAPPDVPSIDANR